jgi:hypothetical protein
MSESRLFISYRREDGAGYARDRRFTSAHAAGSWAFRLDAGLRRETRRRRQQKSRWALCLRLV